MRTVFVAMLILSMSGEACMPREFVAHDEVNDYPFVVRGVIESASAYESADGKWFIEIDLIDPIYLRGAEVTKFRTPLDSAACGAEVVVGRYVWIFADSSRMLYSHYPHGRVVEPEMMGLNMMVRKQVLENNNRGLSLKVR